MSKPVHRGVALTAVLVIGIAAAPLLAQGRKRSAEPENTITPLEAFDRLHDFATQFAYVVEAAADQIIAQSNSLLIRRRAVIWKIRSIAKCREALFLETPTDAVADQWTWCVQSRHFLEEGDGKDAFGPWQHIAVDAMREMEQTLVEMAARHVPPDLLAAAREELDAWVRENPLRGPMARPLARPKLQMEERRKKKGSNPLLKLPSIPIRALTGLDESARRLAEVNLTLARVAALAEFVPQQLRWEIELALYDVERRQTVASSLASFQTLASSFDRAVTAAENLPSQIRLEFGQALDTAASQQESLDASLQRAEALAQALDRAAQSIASAGQAWGATGQAFSKFAPEEPRPADARPFDINEYTGAAEAWTATAAEARGLADKVAHIVDSDGLSATLGESARWSRDLVDHAFWRMVQLIAVVFVAAVAYRLVTLRLKKKFTNPQ